jgi:hypothetical protein
MARIWGDRHAYDVQAVLTTHREADRVEKTTALPPARLGLAADAPVYLVAMRGHFCVKATNVTEAACRPAGTIQTSTRSTKTSGFSEASLAERYPDLRALGTPIRLGTHKR